MKAYITVMLKTTVLDPQGKTIHGALKKMGYKGVDAVRRASSLRLHSTADWKKRLLRLKWNASRKRYSPIR